MSSKPEGRVFDLAAEWCSLLSAPPRFRIACALIDGEHKVSEWLEQVAVSQPNMSQYLGTLHHGGVLARRRTGTQIDDRVEHAEVRRLCQALQRQGQFAALGHTPRGSQRRHLKVT
jgi:hypothetical protein